MILEIQKKTNDSYVAIFIDLKKAFDSVRHVDIFQQLMGEGVPKDIIQLLWQIYEKDRSIYIINQEP